MIAKNKTIYNSFNVNADKNVLNTDVSNIDVSNIDLSIYFINTFKNDGNVGLSSSFAITSLMSYHLLKSYNINKHFSPFALALKQYNVTKSWTQIDIFTGLNIVKYDGICCEDDDTMYKVTFGNISLNELTFPFITSIKILPLDDKFYSFLNDDYWTIVNKYYSSEFTNTYAISLIIIGCNIEKKMFHVKYLLSDVVDTYIPFNAINLFFDTFMVETITTITLDNSADLNKKKFIKNPSNSDMYKSDISICSLEENNVIVLNVIKSDDNINQY